MFIIPWLANLCNQHHYTLLSEADLHTTRKTDKIFIFGSGYSINEITNSEWLHFEQHDTLSFNWFLYQDFVRVDYHLIREVCRNVTDPSVWKPKLEEYSQLLRQNPKYANAVLLVHAGLRASMGNRFIGLKQLRPEAKIFRFRNVSSNPNHRPSYSLVKGLYHAGTLADCVNLAVLLGWKKIVLVGVDLCDRRYFWLDYEETREDEREGYRNPQGQHYMSDSTIAIMGAWRELFAQDGVELCVYNPRSLLAQVMPVYRPTDS